MMCKCTEDFFAQYCGLLVVFGQCLFNFDFGLDIEAVDEFYHFTLLTFDSAVLSLPDVVWQILLRLNLQL